MLFRSMEDARAGAIVAREVHGDRIRGGVLIAGKVQGNVETVLDTAGAVAAGLAAGVGLGLLLYIAGLFGGDDED